MLEKKTISDYVYDKILEDIVQLKYAPGEKISETQLAAVLEVSRAPIKSALAKLEKEGFVSIKPQNGTFVSKISLERARGICDVREILEVEAVKKAVHNITEEQIGQLQKLFRKMDSMEEFNDEKRQFIYEADTKLHDVIYKAGGNVIIGEIIQRYLPEIQRIQRANMTWADRKIPTQTEMKKILNALEERDEEKAASAMKEHITNIRKTIETISLEELL